MKIIKKLVLSSILLIPLSVFSCSQKEIDYPPNYILDPKEDEKPWNEKTWTLNENDITSIVTKKINEEEHKKISKELAKEEANYVTESAFLPPKTTRINSNSEKSSLARIENKINSKFFIDNDFISPQFVKISSKENFNNYIIANAKKVPSFENFQDELEIKELFEKLYLKSKDVFNILESLDIYIFPYTEEHNLIKMELNNMFFVFQIRDINKEPVWTSGWGGPVVWKVILLPKDITVTKRIYNSFEDIKKWYNDIYLPTKKT